MGPLFQYKSIMIVLLSASARHIRQVDHEQSAMFNSICIMLERCDSKLCILDDLRHKLKVLVGRDDVYCERTSLNKLKKRYGITTGLDLASGGPGAQCFFSRRF